jgi:pimeloyl-ACP methyl ester carboxylesterase
MNTVVIKYFGVVIGLLVIYILVVFLVYLFQDNFMFFPKKISATASALSNDSTIETITIKTDASEYLHGWLCKKKDYQKQKIIIYFGGNGDEVSDLVLQAKQNLDWSILLVNYPGYGNSDGKPNEISFFNSALKIYDNMVSRNDIDTNNIVIMGRSIGTGVATFLANKRKNRGVILISPFESMANVVKDKFGFILPVNLILRSKFDSKSYASKINSPLLCIYGTNDKIIPMRHSKSLMKYWGGKVESHELNGFNHNNLIGSKEVWDCINEFLLKLDK